MNTVVATAINAPDWVIRQSVVTSVEYRRGSLTVQVTEPGGVRTITVQFEEVEAFRVLDERDLQEFWPACSSSTGGLFEVTDGGWLSQEMQRPGSLLAHMHPNLKEYLLTGSDECVNVLANISPTVCGTT